MQVMIRYKLKPDQVEGFLSGLSDVYGEYDSARPDWLRQATFQLDDKVSFVTFTELDDPGRLAGMPVFQQHRRALDERCDEPPVVTMLHKVGSYRSPL
jgi:hypothetical protein